ncbi:MAG: nucleotidyltransferase family protein [Candidatus Hodarchaeales archaeon]|jgi:molybdenum cofactor cytidylyltransferase
MPEKGSQYGALILAAGSSSRFQSNKFLAVIDGIPLIHKTLMPFLELESRIKAVYVVTGAYTDDLKTLLRELNVKQLHNPLFSSGGMSSSVKIGISHLQKDSRKIRGIFVHPGDIPFLETDDLLTMIDAFERSLKRIFIPTFGERRGHPLLIHMSIANELKSLREEKRGLRGFLADHSNEIEYVASNNHGILRDVDSPEDIMRKDS